MMKKLFRSLALLVVPAMLLSLSACSSSSGKSGSDPANAAPTEISYYGYGTGIDQNQVDKVCAEINKISLKKINVTVKMVLTDSGSYGDKMRLILASQQDFDLCFTSSWLNDFSTNATKGAYLPLNDLLKKKAPKLYASVDAALWNAVKINGNIYGIFASNGYQGHVKGYAVNKALAQKYNFDYTKAKKPADYEPFLEAVKKNEPTLTPFLPDINVLPMPFNLETGYTIDYVRPVFGFDKSTGSFYNYLENKDLVNLLSLYHGWYNKGYIPKDIVSRKDLFAEQSSGKYALFAVGNILPGTENMTYNGVNYICVPWTPAYISTAGIMQNLLAVNAKTKHADQTLEFCELAFEDTDVANLIYLGIKDQNYSLNGQTATLLQNTGYGNVTFPHDITKTFLTGSQTANDVQRSVNLNKTGSTLPLTGFTFDQTPVKSQMTEISSIMSKYVPLLCTGTADPATTIPDITQQLNKADISTVLKEVKNQFDTWTKSNK